MPTIIFEHPQGEYAAHVSTAGSLASVCDVKSAIPFHCRIGECGTCRISVLEGQSLLVKADPRELGLLAVQGLAAPASRLACQVSFMSGDGLIRVRALTLRMSGSSRYRVLARQGTGTGRMLIRLAGLPDPPVLTIVMPDGLQPEAGAVVVIEFKLPDEPYVQEVIARIVDYEAEDDAGESMVELELLETNDLLAGWLHEGQGSTLV